MKDTLLRLVRAIPILLALPLHTPAQTAAGPEQPSTFEVISIRPVPPDSMGGFSEPAGTEFRVKAMQLTVLVQMAFGVNPDQLVLPDWAQNKKFDIQAKTGSSVPLTYEQMKPLLQALLRDRFGMTFHQEVREVQGFNLVAVRSGLKLEPSQPGAAIGGTGRPGAIDYTSTTMPHFAAMLALFLKRPVADKTDAAATYKISFRYAPDDTPDSPYPALTTALQEQLGVKLVPAKVPVKMVVIDHLEKMATEN